MSEILSKKDYDLLTKIIKQEEKQLLQNLSTLLRNYYKDILITKDYIIAKGTSPIGLVAHLDTVFSYPPEDIFYDTVKNVIWSPQGLGADDRAGIFLILKILQFNFRPTIIFTTGEENGGIGASKLIEDIPACLDNLNFLIELDRRGSDDCVFYNCGNKDFHSYIENFGFVTNYGTFSDISVICPSWDIAGVNFSVGYINEHSYSEHLYVNNMLATLKKLKNILNDAGKNVKDKFTFQCDYYSYDKSLLNEKILYTCWNCHKIFTPYEGIDIITKEGKSLHYCDNCFTSLCNNVSWCEHCFQPFEPEEGKENLYCVNCLEELSNGF